MRKDTVDAALDLHAVLLLHLIIPRTVRMVQRAVAEEAVEIPVTLVARIILTFLIREKPARIARHDMPSYSQ